MKRHEILSKALIWKLGIYQEQSGYNEWITSESLPEQIYLQWADTE